MQTKSPPSNLKAAAPDDKRAPNNRAVGGAVRGSLERLPRAS
jgi:hypothetical protein